MPDSPQSLGEYFSNLEIKDSERERISKIIVERGLHFEVLKKYASSTKPYSVFQKKERIPGGFRPGTPAYHNQAITRISKYLTEPSNTGYKIAWAIFRHSAISYVVEDLKDLNVLLLEVKLTPKNDRDAFAAICKNANTFNVSPETVRLFYNLWWIDRFDDIDSILQTCSNVDETASLQRAIKTLSNQVNLLRNQLESVVSSKSDQELVIGQLSDAQHTLNASLNELREASNETAKNFHNFTQRITQKYDQQFSQLDNRLHSFNERFKELDQRIIQCANDKETKQELKRV